jgi:hypothetical protein
MKTPSLTGTVKALLQSGKRGGHARGRTKSPKAKKAVTLPQPPQPMQPPQPAQPMQPSQDPMAALLQQSQQQ